jgi:hypothetical protein
MSITESATGSPPAITHDQLENWRQIADDVDAALQMGGEIGMDLLVGRMADWCTAVDELNGGLRTCWEMGARGLRHEAINWHADGFFETGDRLRPDRPGWDQWRAAFLSRGIATPQLDDKLKEKVDRMFDDLSMRNLSGQTLRDQLDSLRRNVLVHGHLGERLTLLESIRSIDAGRPVWDEMLAPLREQRAEKIAVEVDAAVARGNFATLAALREEVASVNWASALPPQIITNLEAAAHWEQSVAAIEQLNAATQQFVARCAELREIPINSPTFVATLETARQARTHYHLSVDTFTSALRAACDAPNIAAQIKKTDLLSAGKKMGDSAKPALSWLEGQDAIDRLRGRFLEMSNALQRLLNAAPVSNGSWDDFKAAATKWLDQSKAATARARSLCREIPSAAPKSMEVEIDELGAVRMRVEKDLAAIKRWEKIIIACVVGTVVLLFLIAIVGVIIAAIPRR